MFENRRLIDIKTLVCQKNNLCTLLCCSENCAESALICSNPDCQCNERKHTNCHHIRASSFFNNLQNLKITPNETDKQVFNSIIKAYEEMVVKIKQQCAKFKIEITMFGLGITATQFIRMLKEEKNKINGKIVMKVREEISNQNIDLTHYDESIIINNFWQQQVKRFQTMLNKLSKYRFPNLPKAELSSKIVNQEQQQRIRNFFKKKVKCFNLIFRASQHNFQAAAFHSNCDGKTHTLVICRTEFGKIIGGYTPIAWKSTYNENTKQKDDSLQSFLFSVSLNERYDLTQNSFAIQQDPNNGPTFGFSNGSRDLGILNNCNTANNWNNFPSAYNNGKYLKSPESHSHFCGSPSSKLFKISEYEVFQVIFRYTQ